MAEPVVVTTDPVIGGHHAAAARARRIVAALAITQTVGYGTLYYAFAVWSRPPSPCRRSAPPRSP